MHFATIVLAIAGSFGFANAAAIATRDDYTWHVKQFAYSISAKGYSVSLKGRKHGDVPKWTVLCTGDFGGQTTGDCTVTYDGPDSGEGSIDMYTQVKIRKDGDGNKTARLIVNQFYVSLFSVVRC